MGHVPAGYALFKAAQFCNCAPWELLEQSVYWRDRAIVYLSAENQGREILARMHRS
jgi:hypothetical protein